MRPRREELELLPGADDEELEALELRADRDLCIVGIVLAGISGFLVGILAAVAFSAARRA